MPIVQIHMIEGRSEEQKRALVRKVTDAICETANCPPEAVNVIISNMASMAYAEAGILHIDKK
jgi:4-oxalocrotonate tautomerase